MVILSAVLLIAFNSFFILANGSSDNVVKDFGSNPIALNYVRVLDASDDSNEDDAFDEDDSKDESISDEQLIGIDGLITRSEAEKIAIDEVGGRVVGFESERENGRVIYDVELSVNGEDVEVEVDALTGEIGEIEYGDDD